MTDAKQSFPPLIKQNSEILILGTLPSEDSLKFQQYYGHSRNAFWRIMGNLTQSPELQSRDYEEKVAILLSHGFALWDTLARAKRQGSLDSAIREPIYNNIPQLLSDYPRIHTIGFNGKSARKLFKQHEGHLHRNIVLCDLPSTSPAYTLSFEKKLAIWHENLLAGIQGN